ncbi:MAG: hypothetical protein ACK2UU_04330 [Anaerolineae bacterium]|jgi:hypothetical protein
MNKDLASNGLLSLRRIPRARYLLPVVALLVIGGGYLVYRVGPAQRSDATEPLAAKVSEATLESEYGIHINLLAVIAAGGIIDLRFKVLDSEKAAQLLDTPQPRLAIIAEDSGMVIQAPPDTEQNFTLQDGVVYFVQFPNVSHAVEAGRPVSLVIGDVRLEQLIAK